MDFFVSNDPVMSYVPHRRTTFFLDLWENGINWVVFRFFYMKKLFWLIEICIIRTGDHSLINNKICFKKKFPKYNVEKNNVSSSFATCGNITEVCKIGTFQGNISTVLLEVLNIYFFFRKISESWNCNVTVKSFAIFDKNVATIF